MALPAAPEVPGFGALSPLGAGPTSSIFSAHSEQMGRWVALTIYTTTPHDRDFNEFRRAYELARRLGVHPHAVTMLDWGVTPDRRPYVVTEFYEHGTFDSRVSGNQPLPVDKTLRIGIALAGALETAHRADVIHGGVHPARILADSDDEPSLADTGLVPLVDPSGPDALLGPTNYHAPPEVLEDDRLGPATDVYSLASTLYTLLTARPPYAVSDPEDTSAALLLRVLRHEVPPINRHDVPDTLQQTLLAALSSDPRQRPAGIIAFAQILQSVQREIGAPVTEPVLLDVAPGLKVVAENGLAEPVRNMRAELNAAAQASPMPAAATSPAAAAAPETTESPALTPGEPTNKLVPKLEPHPGVEPTPPLQMFVPYPVPEPEEHPWFGPPVLDPPVPDPDDSGSESAPADPASDPGSDPGPGALGLGLGAVAAGSSDGPPSPQPGWASLLAEGLAAGQTLGDPRSPAPSPERAPEPAPEQDDAEADGPPLHQRLATAWPAQSGPPAATPGLLPEADPAPAPSSAPFPAQDAPSPVAPSPVAVPSAAPSQAPFAVAPPTAFAPPAAAPADPGPVAEPPSPFAPPPPGRAEPGPAPAAPVRPMPGARNTPGRADEAESGEQNAMAKGPRALPVIVLALIVALLFVAAAWMVVSGTDDSGTDEEDGLDRAHSEMTS